MPAQGSSARSLLGAGAGLLGFSAIAGLLVTVMVAPAIAVTGMTANNSISVFQEMPDYITIDKQHERNTIAVRNPDGSLLPIATWFDQNREEVTLDQIDEDLKWAAIDGEDRRFYEHGGVDMPSLIRAAVGQATKTSSSGASTLTMQLVRNILVLRAVNNTDYTEEQRTEAIEAATYPDLNRKLREMKLAIGMEKKYSKDEILAAYLNIVGMGSNTYGVEAGAQRFFGTSAKDVTPAQAASLIAIVQNPVKNTLIYPENYERNEKRRNVILGWMYTQGHLDKAQYEEALATPVDETTVSSNPPKSGCAVAAVEYRLPCDYALKSVLNGEVPSLGSDRDEQIKTWREGGLTLVLSINPDTQTTATQVAQQYAPPEESRFKLGAALASVQVGTGRIISMAQNKVFDDTGTGDPVSTSAVNLTADASHGASKGFQPGSTYKPYVLLAFLNAGHGLNETFNASVRDVPMAKFQDSCGGPYGGRFKFRNDQNESGLYTVTRGTAGSVNSVFIQMAMEVDQCDIAKLAASIGVHRADGKRDGSDLSTLPVCSIGGCENNIAPLTQAAAYAAISNHGVYCEPIIVDDILDANGESLGGQVPDCGQSLVTPAVADTAAYAMQSVMGGTASASNPRDGTPYMGKTGTTDAAVHTWMVGSSPQVATAVWVGNIEGEQNLRRIYVNGVQASVLRHKIFLPYAKKLDTYFPGGAFAQPDPALLKGVQVNVPDVLGLTPEQAKSAIELANLAYEDGGQMDSDLPVGTVVGTDPGAGSQVPKGTGVRVFTSNGQAATVPDVVSPNQNYNDAKDDLQAAGFTNVTQVCEEAEPGDPPGTMNNVVAQNPAAGSVVNKGIQVTLTVRKMSCP
ncbi:transglycosylase domain-containing protein [Protaetiibacter sp. SSC-01]|uniref:transglycosylase domain-containing protein n=1 Tax=Protaetiibacter sp. SSC-01 TaxID=2759943 RepID=UPI0016572160|nr:transglycosylase domain-containing protein [Protaetiibacter sp. SSC-01]QNO37114.1 transglycosylase domain-containing protein [Protaetiibacter sp. SSC-01]